MAKIPQMAMTEPTEEDKAFHQSITAWLLCYEVFSEQGFNSDESIKRVFELKRRCKETYIQLGQELIWVKRNLKHGEWLEWLNRVDIPAKTAQVYMRVAENPQLYDEARGNLANVRVGKFVRLTNSDNADAEDTSGDGEKPAQEVIDLIDKLGEAMRSLSKEDKEDEELEHSLDYIHAKLHRMKGLCPKCIDVPKWENGVCPNCGTNEAEIIAQQQRIEYEEIEEYQEGIETKERWEELMSHPAYPWTQVLIIKSGRHRGELRDKDWLKRAYSRGYDTLAQELGYEGNHVPYVGHAPTCELMPDNRFTQDLQDTFQLESRLKNKASELGIRLEPVDIKGRLPPRNKPLLRTKRAKSRPKTAKPGQPAEQLPLLR